jgi:two-component system sensor histidine kinase DegS
MNPFELDETADTDEQEWQQLKGEITDRLDQSRKELKEIALLLEQSQLEVNKLTQRNATATGQLQRIHMQFESLPREEIRAAYDLALDAQQRLFVMRGQVEKLQSDYNHLKRFVDLMDKVAVYISNEEPSPRRPRSATATVELLEMLIQAQEAERQRLSRQMHDGPAQALSNLILETEIAMRLFDIDKAKAYEELNILKNSATEAFQQVRDFIFELRPMMLDDLGLVPTIKKYTSAIKEQTGIDLKLDITGSDHRLESYLEVMVFRAIQELLSNAISHSQANQVDLQIHIDDEVVRVSVSDDGIGFDPEAMEVNTGMGLKVIKERVEMVGGTFTINSQVGSGTQVSFQVPAALLMKHD